MLFAKPWWGVLAEMLLWVCSTCVLKTYLLIGLWYGASSVRINKLHVPEVAKLGHPVVLDCDYTLEESQDEGLVVKWYFNEKPTPVYQWIPNKKPQELGILKGRLDLEYSISRDIHNEYRALRILEPAPDLSGNYTCLVSTFRSEDRQTKRMLVLVPEKRLELRQEYIGSGMFRVMCYAEGVFPKPSVSLLIGNSEVNDSKTLIQEREGLFDVRVVSDVPTLEMPEEFSCELRIPQANYTVRKEAIYYPVASAAPVSSSIIFGVVPVFIQVLFW